MKKDLRYRIFIPKENDRVKVFSNPCREWKEVYSFLSEEGFREWVDKWIENYVDETSWFSNIEDEKNIEREVKRIKDLLKGKTIEKICKYIMNVIQKNWDDPYAGSLS